MNQSTRVLSYIITHGSITAIQAEQHLNCHRLAARIADLRAAGVQVETTIVRRDGSHWASYSLKPAPEQMEMAL